MKCQICERPLDRTDDPLSLDCGGDCWGCVGQVEAEMGCDISLERVRQEHAAGLRPDWIDPHSGVDAAAGGAARR